MFVTVCNKTPQLFLQIDYRARNSRVSGLEQLECLPLDYLQQEKIALSPILLEDKANRLIGEVETGQAVRLYLKAI